MSTIAPISFKSGVISIQEGRKNTLFYFTYPYGLLRPAMTNRAFQMNCRGSFLLQILKISCIVFFLIEESLCIIPMTILYNAAACAYNKLKGEKIFAQLQQNPLEDKSGYYTAKGILEVRYTGDLFPFGVAKGDPPSSGIDRIRQMAYIIWMDIRDTYIPYQGASLRMSLAKAHRFFYGF